MLPAHFLHGTLCVTTAMSVSLYMLIEPTSGLITQNSGTRTDAIRPKTTTAHVETHNPGFGKQQTHRELRISESRLLCILTHETTCIK